MSAVAPAPGRLRRRRAGLVVVAGAVLAVALTVLLAGGASTGAAGDPDNPGPDGAQALARVLAAEGVDVRVARDADELEDREVGPSTTVLVTGPDLLGAETGRRLLAHAAAGRLIIAGAGPGTAEVLGLDPDGTTIQLDDGRTADCAEPGLAARLDGLRLEVDDALAYELPGCFDGDGGTVLAEPRPGLLLLGADQALTNDQVLRADNAAVALRLLGDTDQLVWYVPSADDLDGEDGAGLAALAPPWIAPALFLTVLVVVALALARGRRLGPLAVEPMPVVVRAIETTRSRGRLYRHHGDRAHAAQALRRATRRRLAARLRLGSGVRPEALAAAVAERADRPAAEIAALLDPTAPPPGTDRDLVTLATQLAQLEEEVRHP